MKTSFIQHIQQLVKQQPEKAAFIFLANGEVEQGRLSYAELDQQAQQVSLYLQQHSEPGDRIILCYLPGLEFVSAFLGCLYAGRIAVPVYPLRNNHHTKRLLAILEDCEPALILGTAGSLNLMQAQSEWVHYRYGLTETIFTQTPGNSAKTDAKPAKIMAKTIAFLQYTSGSTGAPKGVKVSHGNILANLEAIHHFYGLTQQNNIVSWLPMQHDMGLIGQLLYALYCGTTEVFMPPAAFLEKPIRWLKAITHYQGHAAGGPNFGYALCVERVTPEQMVGLDLSTWKIAFNGSEPIRAETLTTFAQKFEPCGFTLQKFLPCYGMAETTLLISGKPRETTTQYSHLDQQSVVSSGRVYPAYTVKIVNPQTHEALGNKTVGEIWVAGPSVAHGYWNKIRLNKITFKAQIPHEKTFYLRTGDLGFFDDEQLYVTGRLKDLIILQGRNVYPQDIEAAVENSCDVVRVGCTAAFSVEIEQQEQVVIVAEVKRTKRKMDFTPVFHLIRQVVIQAVEVIPYAIVLIAPAKALRTTSGKIQRQATKEAYLADKLATLAVDKLTIAPTTQKDQTQLIKDISELLQKLLGKPSIDPQKPFNLMGGTSLEAVILQQQLQAYVGDNIKLPATLVFDYPTVQDLSDYLWSCFNAEVQENPTSTFYHDAPILALAPMHKVDRTAFLPLSLNERAAWIADQEKSGHSYLNMKMLMFIEELIDPNTLENALNKIVENHEILRTSYHQKQDGSLYRQIHQNHQAHLIFKDLSTLSSEEQEKQLGELAKEVEFTRFVLMQLPLFKFMLVKINQQKFALIFALHHIIGDGLSVAFILAELMNTYHALFTKTSPAELPHTLTYTDYAQWQQQMYAAGLFKPLIDYWEKHITNVEDLMLPYDKLKTSFTDDKAGVITIHLEEKQITELQTFATQHKVSLYVLFMGALQLLLKKQTLQDEFLIETILSNRTDNEHKSMLGALAVDAVVLYQLNENFTIAQFLSHLLTQTLQLNHLLRDCGPLLYNAVTKINPHQPIVGINYHVQSAEIMAKHTIKMDADYFARQSLPGNLDLFLEIWPAQNTIALDFIYRQSIFRHATLESLTKDYLTILTTILKNPHTLLSDL